MRLAGLFPALMASASPTRPKRQHNTPIHLVIWLHDWDKMGVPLLDLCAPTCSVGSWFGYRFFLAVARKPVFWVCFGWMRAVSRWCPGRGNDCGAMQSVRVSGRFVFDRWPVVARIANRRRGDGVNARAGSRDLPHNRLQEQPAANFRITRTRGKVPEERGESCGRCENG